MKKAVGLFFCLCLSATAGLALPPAPGGSGIGQGDLIIHARQLAGESNPDEEQSYRLFSMAAGSRAWLGVKLRDLTEAELKDLGGSDDLGVFVVQVMDDSPASRAGMQNGDIVVRFAGLPVLGTEHFIDLVRNSTPGRSYGLELFRSGKRETVRITMSKREGEMEAFQFPGGHFELPVIPDESRRKFKFFTFNDRPRLGIYHEDLTEQLGQFFGVPGGKGVLVTSVVAESPAAKAGILAGDVIVALDGAKIENSGDLLDKLADKETNDTLTIRVYRKGKTMDFKVDLGDKGEKKSRKTTL